jgi:drug/metabolite transporter (DMT)-like permease
MMTNQGKAYICVALAVFFWSTAATAFKLALRDLDFLQVLFFSSIASLVALFAIILIRGKVRLLFEQNLRDVLHSVWLGFLNPFLYYVVLFKAYSLLPAQEAQPLNYTWPIALAVLSVPLLKQRLSRLGFVAIVVSFMGVLVISTRGELTSFRFENPLGVSLAVGSSFAWATFWIYNVKDRRDPVIKLFTNFGFGVLYITVFLIIVSDPILPSFSQVARTGYIGLFEMGLTFVLWLTALSLARSAASIAHFAFLAPFVSLIFIHLVLGEHIRPSSVVGLVLIVAGIMLQATRGQFRRREP